MREFKIFLANWNAMCIHPTGNTIILSQLDKYFINDIKTFMNKYITEEDKYYVIKYGGNIIKIQK